jgi:dTDP-4-dehydrorhamnose 3,5-epimerase
MDGVKLVTCIQGAVMDVLLDLRIGSPTCRQHEVIHLSDSASSVLCIPPGVAHGFYVPAGGAVLLYKMDKVHSPAHDTGIHWSSAGIDWPDKNPIISDRDAALPPLAAFQSPFTFQPESVPSFVS